MEQALNSNVTVESEFATKKISSLFWKYGLLAIFGVLLQFIQAIADGFFVGNGIGPLGLATVSIIIPICIAYFALFGLFGIGSSTLAAIKLGNGDKEGARKVYGNVQVFSLYFTVVLCLVVAVNLDGFLMMLGATPDVLPLAKDYTIALLVGIPFCVLGTNAYYFTRLAEKPLAASIFYVAPAILAIGFEYLLIFQFKVGMASSAIAWIFCIGVCVFLIPYLQAKTIFKIKLSDFAPDFKLNFEVCKIGFPAFIIQFSAILLSIFVNRILIKNGGGYLELASYGIISGYFAYTFGIMSNALASGIQPIASYNLGAKMYSRVSELVKVGVSRSLIVLVPLSILIYIFTGPIASFFTGNVPELISATKSAYHTWGLLISIGTIAGIVSGYYMAVEKIWLSILNGISRSVIFGVPLLLIFSKTLGLQGVWIAQPIADSLAFIFAIVCLSFEIKRLKKMQ